MKAHKHKDVPTPDDPETVFLELTPEQAFHLRGIVSTARLRGLCCDRGDPIWEGLLGALHAPTRVYVDAKRKKDKA